MRFAKLIKTSLTTSYLSEAKPMLHIDNKVITPSTIPRFPIACGVFVRHAQRVDWRYGFRGYASGAADTLIVNSLETVLLFPSDTVKRTT